jgi:hypothetical protein
MQNLPKHEKYKTSYCPGEIYWGIGVEHESYIESAKKRVMTKEQLKTLKARERYSVDYYKSYNADGLAAAFELLPSEMEIPILLNAHSFQATDLSNNHRTTYEKVPKPNPKFSGQTVIEFLKSPECPSSEYFNREWEGAYIFDGDTIEIISQKFYKVTIDDVIEELEVAEKEFIDELNRGATCGLLAEYGPFCFTQKNYGWATFLTNPRNASMFNNGTIHINVTLPTRLGEDGKIANFDLFIEQHRTLIRVLQWLSPLMIAIYGSGDPFAEYSPRFAKGSQRVAVSRYIGLGTYDTEIMPVGKYPTVRRDELTNIDWYADLYKETDYVCLEDIGLDFNFNKHYSHGAEMRIFDAIPLKDVYDLLEDIVFCMDFSLSIGTMMNPKKSPLWQGIVKKCVHYGREAMLTPDEQVRLFWMFGMNDKPEIDISAEEAYRRIIGHLKQKFDRGFCATNMIRSKKEKMIEEVYQGLIEEIIDELVSDEVEKQKEVERRVVKEVSAPLKKWWCC